MKKVSNYVSAIHTDCKDQLRPKKAIKEKRKKQQKLNLTMLAVLAFKITSKTNAKQCLAISDSPAHV